MFWGAWLLGLSPYLSRRTSFRGGANSSADFVFSLFGVLVALAFAVFGLILILRAPLGWYWRVLAAIPGFLVLGFWLIELTGVLL